MEMESIAEKWRGDATQIIDAEESIAAEKRIEKV